MAYFATNANPTYGLLHGIAAVALGLRYILSRANIAKIQGKKKDQHMIANWFAHGRNGLLGHFRGEKRPENQDKLYHTAI